MKEKIVVTSLAGLWSILANAPDTIKTSMYILFLLLSMDMVTGVIAAAVCRQLRSSTMREKLVLKLLSYVIILTITFAGTLVTSSWLFYGGGVLAVSGIEINSLVENLTKWQKYSNVNLGKAGRILNEVAHYFEGNQEGQQVVKTTTATILPADSNTDVVSVTRTERMNMSSPEDRKG